MRLPGGAGYSPAMPKIRHRDPACLAPGDALPVSVLSGPERLAAEWATSDPSIATVEVQEGKAHLCATRPGVVTVTARLPGGEVLEKPFEVVDLNAVAWLRLELEWGAHPANRFPFTCQVGWENGFIRDVTRDPRTRWFSTEPSVAQWGDEPGVLLGVGEGDVSVLASYGGRSATLTFRLAGGVLSRLHALLRYEKELPWGVTERLDISVQTSTSRHPLRVARGVSVEVSPADAAQLSVQDGDYCLTTLRPASLLVVATLGAQRLSERIELRDAPVHFGNIQLDTVPYQVWDGTVYVGKGAEATVKFGWRGGNLSTGNISWSSDRPDILRVVPSESGCAILGVSPGYATLTAACLRRNVSQQLTVQVVADTSNSNIEWF